MEIDFMFDEIAKTLSNSRLLYTLLKHDKSPLGKACAREYLKRYPPFYISNGMDN